MEILETLMILLVDPLSHLHSSSMLVVLKRVVFWLLSFFYSFHLRPKLRISQSSSFLVSRWQRGRCFWLFQTVGSWSWPSHGQAGWSVPPLPCPTGGSQPPCALSIGPYRLLLVQPSQYTGLVSSGMVQHHVNRWWNTPHWRLHMWWIALLANFAQSGCCCGS